MFVIEDVFAWVMPVPFFLDAIYKASLQAGVKLKQVSFSGAAPDHPVLLGVEETKYLKFYIFQVI